MSTEQDKKQEPVQDASARQDDHEFMDTGVLHESPRSVRGSHAVKKDDDE